MYDYTKHNDLESDLDTLWWLMLMLLSGRTGKGIYVFIVLTSYHSNLPADIETSASFVKLKWHN